MGFLCYNSNVDSSPTQGVAVTCSKQKEMDVILQANVCAKKTMMVNSVNDVKLATITFQLVVNLVGREI